MVYNYTVFEDISLGEGQFFEDADRSSEKYLTTKKTDDPNCIGRINSFGKDMSFSIRTLKTYFDNSADPLNKSFIICTNNNDDYHNLKKQLKAAGSNERPCRTVCFARSLSVEKGIASR